MIKTIANSWSAILLLIVVVIETILTVSSDDLFPLDAALSIAGLALYLHYASDMFMKFRQQYISVLEILKFMILAIFAMLPVYLIDFVVLAPFAITGLQKFRDPVIQYTIAPLVIFAKCWVSLAVWLTIYEKDQVGVMKRSWNLGKLHFRKFLPIFAILGAAYLYGITIVLFVTDTKMQVAYTSVLEQGIERLIFPYLYFKAFYDLGIGTATT